MGRSRNMFLILFLLCTIVKDSASKFLLVDIEKEDNRAQPRNSIQLCKKVGEVCHRSGPMGPPYNADCCDGGQCATYDSGPYGRRTGECKKADAAIKKNALQMGHHHV